MKIAEFHEETKCYEFHALLEIMKVYKSYFYDFI